MKGNRFDIDIGVFDGDVVLRFNPSQLKVASSAQTPSLHLGPDEARKMASALTAMATRVELEKEQVQ